MPAEYGYDDWTCELLDSSSTSLQMQTDKDDGCAMVAGGLSAGTYYFKVSSGDSDTFNYDLYVSKQTGTLESEPNDASGQATSVTYADWTSDTPIFGESEETSDSADFYSFSLGSALGSDESLIISPEMLGPDPTSLDFELQDSSNMSITTGSGALVAPGLAAGTYYLKVDGASSSSDGQYKIGADVYAPDESFTMSTATTFPNDDVMGKDTTVTASNCATVTRVTLDVDISHEYRGDVVIKLTNPAGTTVQVRDFVQYGYQDDIIGNYPLTLTPDGDLSTFNMASGNGTWTLNVSDQNDTYAGDGGTLNSWTLNLSCQ
jgi:subtilisin-like proprotein convertase family protein